MQYDDARQAAAYLGLELTRVAGNMAAAYSPTDALRKWYSARYRTEFVKYWTLAIS